MCMGAKGGAPGHETIVMGALMCDHCSALLRTPEQSTVLLEQYDGVLRELAFYLSAGGYNSDGLIDPHVALDKIKWGINYMITTESTRNMANRYPVPADREQFEYWCTHNTPYSLAEVASGPGGEYEDPRASAAWAVWRHLTCPAQPAYGNAKIL